jgi:hypothetical protein
MAVPDGGETSAESRLGRRGIVHNLAVSIEGAGDGGVSGLGTIEVPAKVFEPTAQLSR